MKRWNRVVLAVVSAAIGLTAIAGGGALIFGAVASSTSGGIVPDQSFLGDSPFASYLVPGILLAVVVGGIHLLASFLIGSDAAAGPFTVAAASFALLIWIFVQMMYIPFSPLQAVYFALGLAELGFLLLGLGLVRNRRIAVR